MIIIIITITQLCHVQTAVRTFDRMAVTMGLTLNFAADNLCSSATETVNLTCHVKDDGLHHITKLYVPSHFSAFVYVWLVGVLCKNNVKNFCLQNNYTLSMI